MQEHLSVIDVLRALIALTNCGTALAREAQSTFGLSSPGIAAEAGIPDGTERLRALPLSGAVDAPLGVTGDALALPRRTPSAEADTILREDRGAIHEEKDTWQCTAYLKLVEIMPDGQNKMA